MEALHARPIGDVRLVTASGYVLPVGGEVDGAGRLALDLVVVRGAGWVQYAARSAITYNFSTIEYSVC